MTITLNKLMVKNGWAIYSKDYVEDENFARLNKLGIWKNFTEPELCKIDDTKIIRIYVQIYYCEPYGS